jgi:O-antigen ligase
VGFLGIIWFIVKKRFDYVIILFLLTLIMANNRSPVFASYEPLRALFAVVLFLLSGFIVFREKGVDPRVMYFLPFFAVALISSFLFSPVMIHSVFRVISYLFLVVAVFVLIKYLLMEEQFELYEQLLLLLYIIFLVSLVGRVIYPAVFLISGRLNGALGNPDGLGLFCVVSYILTDQFKVKDSRFSERSIFFLKLLIIIALFLSGSRTSLVGLGIYILLTVFLFRGFSGRSIATLLIVGAVLAIVEIRPLVHFFPFMKSFVRVQSLSTASGRNLVWPVAVNEIYRQPWLGGGFTYYHYYMGHFARSHGLKGVYWYSVWDSYLAMLLDTGIIGLLAYFFFIYGVIRRSARFVIILPFLAAMIFTAVFESWAVSSLNAATPFFLLIFVIISIHGSRYENFSLA